MSYKTYTVNTDIVSAFKTEPKTPGINATSLRAKYYSVTQPGTKTEISGVVTEDDGTYFTPVFQIGTAGTYFVIMEYSSDAGLTWSKVGETEISVVQAGTSGSAGGWTMRAVI